LLEEAKPLETWDALWGIGGHGPFGCYLHPGMGVRYNEYEMSQVSWMPGRYNNKSNLLLYQKDAFNCGLFCTLFVFDFVLTQWGNEYRNDDMRSQKKINCEREIDIPKEYGLGSTFSIKEDKRGDGLAICALVRLELKCLMMRLHCLYFEAYSRDDKFVPCPNYIAPSYEKLIKESLFLSSFKERSVFPYIPSDYDITKALSIGKVQRDQLTQSGHFNYTKESILSGEALKWKGVLFRGWKLPKLIAEILTNYHRNTHFIEYNKKIDEAIKGWHQSRFEAYSKHWEAQTRKKGETTEIEDTPEKKPKGTKDYEVFMDPISKSTRTNIEQAKKRKPTSKSVKKKEPRKTHLRETDKNSKENINQEEEQRKPKSKRIEKQLTSSNKQVQKENDQERLENRTNQESELQEIPLQFEFVNITTHATAANLEEETNFTALETGNHQEVEHAEETVQIEELGPPAVASKAKTKVKRKTKIHLSLWICWIRSRIRKVIIHSKKKNPGSFSTSNTCNPSKSCAKVACSFK
jgi:hypothetical protein